MTDAVISVKGTIMGNRTGEYDNKPFGVIQMQSREKESIKMIEINLADGFDISRYRTGTKADIPVRVGASKDGKRIYYREVPEMDAGNGAQPRSAADAVRNSASKL